MVLQQDRRFVTDRAMGPFFVVVPAPILHFFGVGKRQEPMGVEAFLPEAAVERLDERVVGRLPRTGEVPA